MYFTEHRAHWLPIWISIFHSSYRSTSKIIFIYIYIYVWACANVVPMGCANVGQMVCANVGPMACAWNCCMPYRNLVAKSIFQMWCDRNMSLISFWHKEINTGVKNTLRRASFFRNGDIDVQWMTMTLPSQIYLIDDAWQLTSKHHASPVRMGDVSFLYN